MYGSTTDRAALEEAKANDRYYGLETRTPRLVVAVQAEIARLLDLTSPEIRRGLGVTWSELSGEDWRKLLHSGQECLCQAVGRAAASTGASALLVPSVAVRRGTNVVVFPPLGDSGHLTVVESEALTKFIDGR